MEKKFQLLALLLGCIIFTNTLLAQNLVQNGDFENYSSCPTNYAQITKANNWLQPTTGTPDFYHNCSVSLNPTNNLAGGEWPFSGDGFAGIVLTNSVGSYREYIQTQLTKTLTANRVYYFEMYVSLGDSSNYASDKIGIYFSPDSVHSDSARLFYTPQITTNNVITNKSGWTQISGLYKAHGGEKYLTIGCFNPSNNATLLSFVGGGGTTSSFASNSYYYIDKISLIDPVCDSIPPDRIRKQDVKICTNQGNFNTTLTPSNAGFNYLWHDSTTNFNYNATQIGKYWVYTYTPTCPYIDTFEVKTDLPPVINLGSDTTICSNKPFYLKPKNQIQNAVYNWYNNTTDSGVTIKQNGIYWLKVTTSPTCFATDSIQVQFSIAPNPLGLQMDLCSRKNFPVKLSTNLGANATYLWNNNSTDSTINAMDTGQFWVQITKGSCVITDSVKISNTYIPATILGNDTVICSGNSLTLNSPHNQNNKWYFSNNIVNPQFSFFANSISQTINLQGFYVLEFRKNSCLIKDTLLLKTKNKPTINLGNDTLICFGQKIKLKPNKTNNNYQYSWQNGDTTSQLEVINPGLYWVKANDSICYETDTISITYETEIAVNAGRDTSLCENQSFLITPTYNSNNNITYRWNTDATSPNLNVANSGQYWIEMTKGKCKVRDTIQITFNTIPYINLGADTIYCKGQTFSYQVKYPNATYLWNTQSTDSIIYADSAGTYWAEINNNGCKVRDSVNVTIFPLENLNLGNDTTVCEGTEITLTAFAKNATQYTWNTNDTDTFIKPKTTGTYWVVASASFCKVTDSVQINFIPTPKFSLGNDTTICSNSTLILDSKIDSALYKWDNLSTQKTRTVNTLGYYTLTVTKNGCSATDGLAVTIEQAPNLNLGNDTTLCEGYQLNLTSNILGVSSYLWQDNSVFPYYLVKNAGTYKLTIQKGYCSTTDSISVNYVNKENINLGNDTSYCFNTLVKLIPNVNANSYLWQDSSTKNYFEATKPGIYWVEINSATCKTTDSIILTQKNMPTVSLGPNKTYCKNESVQLNAQNNDCTFKWDDLSTTQTRNVTPPGIFYVTITNNLGCYATDTITLDTFPTYQISLGNDTFMCEGGDYLLKLNQNYNSYLWQDSSTKNYFLATKPGTYFVKVSNQNNCFAEDTLQLFLKAKPTILLKSAYKTCDPNFMLDASNKFLDYLWNDGSTKSTFLVNKYGSVTLKVTDSNYCTNQTTIQIINNCEGNLMMPNVFTPNNDNLNDEFKPAIKNVQTIHFKIFNSWGQLIFETHELDKGWNGKTENNSCQGGVYFYQIEYTGFNQEIKTITGNFTLLN